MSRWESLKSDKGREREWRGDGSGRGRNIKNNRWASLDSNAKVESSRQSNHTSSFRDRQSYQRQYKGTKSSNATLSKIDAVKNNELPNLIGEHDTILNSLKSELLRCQSDESSRDHEISASVQILTILLDKATNTGRLSTVDELPCSTHIFMALLGLLKLIEDQKDVNDENMELSFLLVQTIVSYLKVSCAGSKTNSLTIISLSKSQVDLGITTLSSQYHKWNLRPSEVQSRMISNLMIGIALLAKNNVSKLPPELTARRIVDAVFIPYLLSLRQDSDRTQRRAEVRHSLQPGSSSPVLLPMKHVCEGIISLIGNQSHASAILAPLVEDFTFNYGIEEQTINPLRMKLVGVLLEWLKEEIDTEEIEEIVFASETLSAVINGIRKLRKGNETESTDNDADVQILKPAQKFILEVATRYNEEIRISDEKRPPLENLMEASLQLLQALVACYPKSMTRIGWKLIIEGANRNMNSKISHSSGSSISSSSAIGSYLPNLLLAPSAHKPKMYRSETRPNIVSLAIDSIADLMSVLPWNKWLRQSGTRSTVMVSKKGVTSGLYKTVVDALCSLVAILTNFLQKCNEKSQMKALGRLLKNILMEIPYCEPKLIRAGEDLWNVIIEMALPLNHLCKRSNSNEEKQTLACEILVASSGGTTTPQGNMRGMSVPARSWFLTQSSSSTSFFGALIDSIESKNGKFDQSTRVFSSFLRTLPDIALQRWDGFLKIFDEVNSRSNRSDLVRIEVLESFMLGRRDFEVSFDLKAKNENIITDLDDILLQEWNQNSLQRFMNIYSTLRSHDWIRLDQINGRVSRHVDNILLCCQNSNAKIREGAARAVGEFCTQYITLNASLERPRKENEAGHHELLVYRIHTTMINLCTDKNAGTRSMALFSMGNLSSALKESNEIFKTVKLHEMHNAALSSFDDTNDKVVKNAIRSVGHTSNLLALSLQHRDSEEFHYASFGLLVKAIDSLTSKLWKTLHVALNEEQKAAMTWKERSAAKKHGWGACHSLSLVFEGLWLGAFEDYNDLVTACSKAVQCLIRCPCHHSVLNEKVVLAAMTAICNLPNQFFIKDESQEIILGNVLATSIMILASNNDNKVTAKLSAQNEPFLLHLLNSASIADAAIVLDDDHITSQILGVLYSWMVEGPRFESLSSRAFEIFALALQHSGRWSATVDFEQKFGSRALQKQKQENNSISAPNRVSSSIEKATNEEDEADEL